MTQKELEKYLWGAATQLRGTIDAGDYKQYIFPLLFFKRICDVYDEEFENAEIAAKSNTPSDDARVTVLDIKFDKSRIKLTKDEESKEDGFKEK